MNERIKELVKQFADDLLSNSGYDMREFEPFLKESEKFAELIVAEMLQTCEDHPAWTGRMIGEQIKQHFGVEE